MINSLIKYQEVAWERYLDGRLAIFHDVTLKETGNHYERAEFDPLAGILKFYARVNKFVTPLPQVVLKLEINYTLGRDIT